SSVPGENRDLTILFLQHERGGTGSTPGSKQGRLVNSILQGIAERLFRSVDVGVVGNNLLFTIDEGISRAYLLNRFVYDIHKIQNVNLVRNRDAETAKSSQVR